MSLDYQQFEQRKQDHIDLALSEENQALECNTLDRVQLLHEAIPNCNFAEIDLSTRRFQKTVAKPFFVSSMTAGHSQAQAINTRLVEACAARSWAMGVGSQRRELSDDTAFVEWKTLRQAFPAVSLYSNIGIAQLIQSPVHKILALTESLRAEALIVHCNPLQECIQPEGTPEFKGSWVALACLVRDLPIPVIVKETGCGFSLPTLKRLDEIGVAVVDVSGLGGTHWGRIEGQRAKQDPLRYQAAQTFNRWGVDTASSVMAASSIEAQYEIWGSGGVRHGLDAAKLIALGASSIGFAKPMLEVALQSTEQIIAKMDAIEYELKVAMFCTGSRVLNELRDKLCH